MELRILKYFLMVAKEENITKAAKSLYITQPTLSRQLAQFEEELGVKLFTRSNHKILLTEDGKFLQRRAREILYLSEKTKKELSYDNEIVAGEISIGCGEFLGMNELAKLLSEFQEKYPNVKFDIYSGTAEDIIYRIEHGFLDMGLVFDYINKEKYKFIRLKQIEEWGLLVRKDHKLVLNKFIYPEEIKKESVIISKNKLIQNEFSNWMGIPMEKLNVGATFTLVYNAAMMVKNGMGMAVCLKLENNFEDLKFIPFYKAAISKTILAWKPCLKYSVATGKFIKFIEEKRNATNF